VKRRESAIIEGLRADESIAEAAGITLPAETQAFN
jgi:hypothetical protein